MNCPSCNSRMKCYFTKQRHEQMSVYRNYKCDCGERLATLEVQAVRKPGDNRETVPFGASFEYHALKEVLNKVLAVNNGLDEPNVELLQVAGTLQQLMEVAE